MNNDIAFNLNISQAGSYSNFVFEAFLKGTLINRGARKAAISFIKDYENQTGTILDEKNPDINFLIEYFKTINISWKVFSKLGSFEYFILISKPENQDIKTESELLTLLELKGSPLPNNKIDEWSLAVVCKNDNSKDYIVHQEFLPYDEKRKPELFKYLDNITQSFTAAFGFTRRPITFLGDPKLLPSYQNRLEALKTIDLTQRYLKIIFNDLVEKFGTTSFLNMKLLSVMKEKINVLSPNEFNSYGPIWYQFYKYIVIENQLELNGYKNNYVTHRALMMKYAGENELNLWVGLNSNSKNPEKLRDIIESYYKVFFMLLKKEVPAIPPIVQGQSSDPVKFRQFGNINKNVQFNPKPWIVQKGVRMFFFRK